MIRFLLDLPLLMLTQISGDLGKDEARATYVL